MKVQHNHDAMLFHEDGACLSPEFVRQVLGNPKCTVVQASYSAQALEQDRLATEVRTERMLALLTRCLPYVMDARQGRGDLELECLIRGELRQ